MLYDIFKDIVRRQPDHIAIVHENHAISYLELRQRIEPIGRDLARKLGPQDVLGLCVVNPVDFVSVYLAAAAVKRKIVLIDPRLSMTENAAILSGCDVTHVITDLEEAPIWSLTESVGGFCPGGEGLRVAVVATAYASGENNYRKDDFVVHCTSGTTGAPKAIVLSNENMRHRVMNWARTINLTPADTVLCTLTLAHGHGIDVLMLPGLLSGCRVVAPDLQRISPRRICSLMKEHEVSIFSSLPYMYELFVETIPPERAPFKQLRYLICGSAPLQDATAYAFQEKFGKGINQVYGLSEINVICFNKHPERIGYIGEFIEGIEAQEPPGAEAGEDLELVVRGKALTRGYLKSPQAQAEMFNNGWLATKDLVQRDEQGVRLVGRTSRFINSGGNKINPTEIESALKEHALVEDVVVTAVDDAVYTQQLVAFIKSGSTPLSGRELREHASRRLANYKLPAQFIFVDRFPTNPLGKVQIATLVSEHFA